jgi:hypothetical protein
LESAGDFSAALRNFRQVAAVKSTGAVRFHIARCLERLGKLTEALGEYQAALGDATGADREELVRLATEAVASLDQRLPHLILKRGSDAAWTSVKLDGVPIGVGARGAILRTDPGPHALDLSDGSSERRLSVTLREGENREILLPAPQLTGEPPTAVPTNDRKSSRVGPWLLGSVGLGAIAGGVVLGLLTNAKEQELEDGCYTPSRCPRALEPLHAEGERLALATNLCLGVGAAALASAGVWWWVVPSSSGGRDGQAALRVGVGSRF